MDELHSAFISSNLGSLTKERNEILKYLLDSQIFPFTMEHFTAPSSENFKYIKHLIDLSDLFILILGDEYGSCDQDGISWTQREYEYASSCRGKIIFVILTEKYKNLSERAKTEKLSQSDIKLLDFGESITFAKQVSQENTLHRILLQSIGAVDKKSLSGWYRYDPNKDLEWQIKNNHLNLGGEWYHVHLKSSDTSYIRIGSVRIFQNFNKNEYNRLKIEGRNYNVMRYEPETGIISHNPLTRTRWKGDYLLYDNGCLRGIYNTKREFKETYGDWVVEEHEYSGVHEIDIVDDDNDSDTTDTTYMLQGTFKDCAPSPKEGKIFLFRSKLDRLKFLQNNYNEVLLSKN